VLVLSGDGSRVLKVKPLVYVSLSLSTWRIGGLLLICSIVTGYIMLPAVYVGMHP
jgi:hypothetical protein